MHFYLLIKRQLNYSKWHLSKRYLAAMLVLKVKSWRL